MLIESVCNGFKPNWIFFVCFLCRPFNLPEICSFKPIKSKLIQRANKNCKIFSTNFKIKECFLLICNNLVLFDLKLLAD
jgi:hypothetical protein